DLSSLAFSGDVIKPTEVSVTLDGQPIGTAAVDTTVVDTTDEIGRGQVRVTVPDDRAGDVVLQISNAVNGVGYSRVISIEDAVVDTTRPVVTLVSPSSAGPFETLTIQVDATDEVGLSRIVANIYQNGTLVRSTQSPMNGALSGTHTATVELPDGDYMI